MKTTTHPLVKIFDYDSKQSLVYDARHNMMFLIDNEDVPAMKEYIENGTIPTSLEKDIDILKTDGVLLSGPLDYTDDASEESVMKKIEYFQNNILMRKFVLEVTERCNFMCKYCFNAHPDNNRHHTKRQMSLDIAKKSIDYYFSLYLKFYEKLDEPHRKLLIEHFGPSIGFYGGEPTMNMSVVIDSTEYFFSLDWEKHGIKKEDIGVTMNTNLSYITPDILEFLVKNDVTLFTSLDGIKEYNDSNRVDAAGRGTFDMAYSNLMKIKKYNESYFKKRVSVLAVQTDDCDVDKNREFLEGLGCLIQYLPQTPYNCFVANPEVKMENLKRSEEQWIERKLAFIEKYKDTNLDKCLAELTSLFYVDGIVTDAPESAEYKNVFISCPMGFDNIMIGVDGEMHMCHKTDGSMPFGNVRTGIDYQKLKELYIKFIESTNKVECRSCWAFRFCPLCGATRLKMGEFNNPTTMECDYYRQEAAFNIKLLIAINKRYPDLIEKIMKYKENLNNYKSIVDYNVFMEK